MVKTLNDIKNFIIPELYEVLKNIKTDDVDITELENKVEELTSTIGDESTPGTILARIKALEDTPSEPEVTPGGSEE